MVTLGVIWESPPGYEWKVRIVEYHLALALKLGRRETPVMNPARKRGVATDELIEKLRRDLPKLGGPGGRMPTVLGLSKLYACASVTANRAVHKLANEGFLIVRPRHGIFQAPLNRKRTAIDVAFLYWDHSHRLMPRIGLNLILHGLQSALGTIGFNLHLLPFDDPDRIRMHQGLLSSGQIRYMICEVFLNEEELSLVESWGLKVIGTGGFPEDRGRAHVIVDQWSGTRAVLENVFSMGHRRFAILDYFDLAENGTHLVGPLTKVMRQWMKEKGLSENDVRIHGTPTWPEGPHAEDWENLLSPPLPSVIVCIDDVTGFALLTKLVERGLRVPDDVSIAVIMNGLDFLSRGFFTSLDAAYGEVEQGAALGRLLIQAVRAGSVPSPDRPIIISHKMIIGRSVKRLS